MNLWNQIQIYIITFGLTWLQGNAQQIESDLQPYLAKGELALIGAISKLSPMFGALLQAAIAELGSDVPKLEGNAVAWIQGLAEAYLAKLEGKPSVQQPQYQISGAATE